MKNQRLIFLRSRTKPHKLGHCNVENSVECLITLQKSDVFCVPTLRLSFQVEGERFFFRQEKAKQKETAGGFRPPTTPFRKERFPFLGMLYRFQIVYYIFNRLSEVAVLAHNVLDVGIAYCHSRVISVKFFTDSRERHSLDFPDDVNCHFSRK